MHRHGIRYLSLQIRLIWILRTILVSTAVAVGFEPIFRALFGDEEAVTLPEGSAVALGDVITVLVGSDKIWILRKHGKGPYTVVVQAYVYGLSEGMRFDSNDLPTWSP